MPTVVAYHGFDIEVDDDGKIIHEGNEKYLEVLAAERCLTSDEEMLLFDVDEADASIIEICSLPISERQIVIVKRLEKMIDRYALLVCLGDTYFNNESQQDVNIDESIKKARFTQRSCLEMYILKLVSIGIEYECVNDILVRESFKMSCVDSVFIEFVLSEIKTKSKPDVIEEEKKEEENCVNNIPNELNTEKAVDLLNKLISSGLSDSLYNWKSKKESLAYFASKASDYLGLSPGVYQKPTSPKANQQTNKISWKPFEQLFNMKGLSIAKRDYENEDRAPKDAIKIDNLFT